MYKRINITLADDVLARADSFAARARYTRSGLIAAALDAFVLQQVSMPSAASMTTGGESIAAEASGAYGSVAMLERTAPTLARTTEQLRAFFSARDDVEAVWVFGSVARGTAGPMSDVDVAVLPAGELDSDARWKLRLDLTSRLPAALGVREVDVAVLPDVGTTLGHRALVEGTRVFGDRSRAAAEAEIAAVSAYCDFEPVRRLLGDRLSERLGLDDSR